MIRISTIIMSIVIIASTMPFLTACGTSPPARFYALSSITSEKLAATVIPQNNLAIISIGPVGIPEYLDRQQIVIRNSRSQLLLGEFDMWGGSLENEINRVLADNLSLLLAPKGIKAVTWRSRVPFSHAISVSITRFEASGDSVILKANWGIVEKNEQTAQMIWEMVITKPLAGKRYEDIVGGMSDALADLSRDIALAVEKILEKPRSFQNK
jgi:uncharacterized protein